MRRRDAAGYTNVEWDAALAQIDGRLRAAGRLAVSLSPHLTVEEAYLLARYVRSIDPEAFVALGPVPVVGEDERFPSGFTIHAEKCPNRRGVEKVVQGVGGAFADWTELCDRAARGEFGGVWVSGGYHLPWHDAAAAAALSGVRELVVQDLFPSPLWEQASWQLPGGAYPERQGSFVNHADRLQSFDWSIRPPAGVQVEGRVYWRLLGRTGLYNSRRVLDDVAREIAYFAPVAASVPETGVDLKAAQLAGV